jgi:Transposase DDE domain
MGMQDITSLNRTSETAIQTTRELIHDELFCQRHRTSDRDFTRHRKLPFAHVMVMLLQKTVRSIQLHLHDFFAALTLAGQRVSASSWCEARLKLKHTAFIELNERAILDGVYGEKHDFAVRLWQGHRLLGIDSSLIRLPQEAALGEEFGWVECTNQEGASGRYPQARLSALTDVLNRIVLEAQLVPWRQGERDLALAHLGQMQPGDLGLLDRGFAAFELWAQFIAQKRQFVCRCPRSSFSPINQLFADNQAGRSVVVTLRPEPKKRAEMRRAGLPETIRVRLVTVRLQTGELEVLATNLLDETLYPTAAFAPLYHQRWGIETYYGLIKGRLDLENFSGLSAEAIRQDLHSTIFLSNLESILIQPAQEQLRRASEERKNPAQVNHAVSFHALKSQILALLLSDTPIREVLPKLERLFLDNPVSSRPGRKVPRQKQSAWRSYHYQRNTRKSVF